eukprot:INCI18191.1.p1 GENE.INCI18191.1~~INCI18191.1.p1  ORF type:complete len:159 (+),score=21.16 INCI18191.1:18-494(+)
MFVIEIFGLLIVFFSFSFRALTCSRHVSNRKQLGGDVILTTVATAKGWAAEVSYLLLLGAIRPPNFENGANIYRHEGTRDQAETTWEEKQASTTPISQAHLDMAKSLAIGLKCFSERIQKTLRNFFPTAASRQASGQAGKRASKQEGEQASRKGSTQV